MLSGHKPDYNASSSAVNAWFFQLDERQTAHCMFQLKIPFSRPPSCCSPCREENYFATRWLRGRP